MAGDVLAVKEKVRRYMTEWFQSLQVDKDGDFTFRHNNTQVWVSVAPFRDENTVVKIFAVTNLDVPESLELYKHIATQGSYGFGTLGAREIEGKVRILLGHSLLGETVDPEELKVSLFMVAGLADKVAVEIKEKFGGRHFHEE